MLRNRGITRFFFIQDMPAPPSISKREIPYDRSTELKLIKAAHYRRSKQIHKQIANLDAKHDGAYACWIMTPEVGYTKFDFSNKLKGFENTEEFQQFVAAMDSYAGKSRALFDTEPRYSSNDSAQTIFEKRVTKSTTRDSLRKFFTNLSRCDEYTPDWKSQTLTLKQMFDELLVLTEIPGFTALKMWKATFESGSDNYSDLSDVELLIKILDATARARNEPLLPKHRLEQPITQAFEVQKELEANTLVEDAYIEVL